MKLKVRGGTKSHRQLARMLIPAVLRTLLTKRMSANIEIKVVFKKMRDLGNCVWFDDGSHRPRKFVIEINRLIGFVGTSTTICHELVHLRQFAKGQLYDYESNDLTRWKKSIVDSTQIPYRDQPWEKEARRKERKLFRNWYLQLTDKQVEKITLLRPDLRRRL